MRAASPTEVLLSRANVSESPYDQKPEYADDSAVISLAFHTVAAHLGTPQTPDLVRSDRSSLPGERNSSSPTTSDPTLPESRLDPIPLIESETESTKTRNQSDTSTKDSQELSHSMLEERLRELDGVVEEDLIGARLRRDFTPGMSPSPVPDLSEMGDAFPPAHGLESAPRAITLHRCLPRAGLTTREVSQKLITEGEVFLNGSPERNPFATVTPEDVINVKGHRGRLRFQAPQLWAFYKPRNMSCGPAMSESRGRRTLWSWLSAIYGLSHVVPMGTLSHEDRGLILLTNDGDLAQFMMHPSSQIQRTYIAKVVPKIDPVLAEAFNTKGGATGWGRVQQYNIQCRTCTMGRM